MAEEQYTSKLNIDVTNFKAGMQEAERSIKAANAEFKAASAGMKDWSSTSEGLSAKLRNLNTVEEAQKAKLAALEAEYRKVCTEQGNTSTGAENLRNRILGQQAALSKTQSEVSRYTAELAKTESASGKLTATINKQESELNQLKAAYTDIVLSQGKESSAAKDTAEQIQKLSSDLNKNKSALNNASGAADELDSSMKGTETASSSAASNGLGVFQVACGILVSQGINIAVDALKNMVKYLGDSYTAYDDGQDNIIKKTGATGDALADMENSYSDLSKQVVASSGDMGNVIGEVNTRFGLQGDALTDLSKKILEYADLNGVDATESVKNLQFAMDAFGVSADDAGNVLDMFTSVSQRTGADVGTLADDINKYANVFADMGYTIAESTELLGTFEGAGIEGSDALNAMQKAATNFTAAGVDAKQGINDLMGALSDGEVTTQDYNAAVDAFGKRSADALVNMAASGRLSLDDLSGSLDDYSGTVEDTYGATLDGTDKIRLAWQGVKDEVGEKLSSFIDEHSEEISGLMDTIVGALDSALNWISENSGSIDDFVTGLIEGISSVVSWIQLVSQTVTDVVSWVSTEIQSAHDLASSLAASAVGFITGLGTTVSSVFDGAVSVISWAVSAIVEFFQSMWNDAVSIFSSLAGSIGDSLSGIYDAVYGAFSGAIEYITSLPGQAVQWGKDFIDGITEGITSAAFGLIDEVSGIASDIASFLHFSTPDQGALKEYETWMPDFMAGLAKGIDDNKSIVTNAISGLSTDMTIKATANGAGGCTTYNVYVDGIKWNDGDAMDKRIVDFVSTVSRRGQMYNG